MDLRNLLGKLDQLSEGTMASAEKKPRGPKFTGKWKGTDPASAAKDKYVGGMEESIFKELEATLKKEPEKRDLMKEFREFKLSEMDGDVLDKEVNKSNTDVYEDLDPRIIAKAAKRVLPDLKAKSTPEGYVHLTSTRGLDLYIGCNVADGEISINIGSGGGVASSGEDKGAVTEIIKAVHDAAVKTYGEPSKPSSLSVNDDASHGVWQHIASKLGLEYSSQSIKEQGVAEVRKANTKATRAGLAKREKRADPTMDAKKKSEQDAAWERLQAFMNQPENADVLKRLSQKEGVEEHIVKVKGGYELKSKHGNKNLGKYPTRAGAEKRERQVQYFKHANESFTDLELAVMEGGHELIKENPVAPAAAPAAGQQPNQPTLGADLNQQNKAAADQKAAEQQQATAAKQAALKDKQEQSALNKGVAMLKQAGAAVSNPGQLANAFGKVDDQVKLNPADKNNVASAGTVLAPIMSNPNLAGKFKDLVTQASNAEKQEQQKQQQAGGATGSQPAQPAQPAQPNTPAPAGQVK